MKVYGILCLALLFTPNDIQAAFASSVTGIIDGDTIEGEIRISRICLTCIKLFRFIRFPFVMWKLNFLELAASVRAGVGSHERCSN